MSVQVGRRFPSSTFRIQDSAWASAADVKCQSLDAFGFPPLHITPQPASASNRQPLPSMIMRARPQEAATRRLPCITTRMDDTLVSFTLDYYTRGGRGVSSIVPS